METETGTSSRWMRLIPMIVFVLCFALAKNVLYFVAILQFIWAAISGEPNENLVKFGRALSKWLGQTARYLTYASDERPFPWDKWPSQD